MTYESDKEWQSKLTKEQYKVTRLGHTEAPFSGAYWNEQRTGSYQCICCNQTLFHSSAKFDAGCGWPSFFKPATPQAVIERLDTSHGMIRQEVLCSKCNAHLGHVFDDGPRPTGLRFCINSAALQLSLKTEP